jgi:predicted glutamine amidotransferase
MCGIILTNNQQFLTKKLFEQMNRGNKGAGFILHNSQPKKYKSANIYKAVYELSKIWTEKSICLFHHRIPTSTSNTNETAHPFSHPEYTDFYGMHNGIISNPNEVIPDKYKNTKWNVKNDSQAIIYEVIEAIINPDYNMRKSEGYASVLTYINGKIYVYRDSNQPDLYLYNDKNTGDFCISSEELQGSICTLIRSNTIFELVTDQNYNFVELKFIKIFTPPVSKYKFDYKSTGSSTTFLDEFDEEFEDVFETKKINGLDFYLYLDKYIETEEYEQILDEYGEFFDSSEIFDTYGLTKKQAKNYNTMIF